MVKDLVKNLCVSLETDIGGVSGATSRKVVVATPVITLTDNSVTITCDTTGAIIYYTLDGSTPTSSSSQYSAAFTLGSSCTIKAIAIKGGKSSGIAEEEYVKPITYLTQWRMMGNSEVHGQEIWSCGEYNATDGKYHILVQPQGGSIADIALDEPLRKVNDVADSIEYANGVATVTRALSRVYLGDFSWSTVDLSATGKYILTSSTAISDCKVGSNNDYVANFLNEKYAPVSVNIIKTLVEGIAISSYAKTIYIYDENYNQSNSATAFKTAMAGVELIYELATPTTEVIQVPQIAEADSYSCVISQGAKAVSWSSFETE